MNLSLSIYRSVRSVLGGYGIEHVFPISVVHKKIQLRVKSDKAIVHGHTMTLDPLDSLCLSIDEDFEEEETHVIRENVKSGDVILDIGANIGFHTLEFARLVGDEGKVYAFEPDPNNFKILSQNIAQNNYDNVVLENAAVLDKSGSVDLYLCNDNHGDHRAFDSGDGRKKVETNGISLDEYFQSKNIKVDFIKMDIQGSEYKALQGMKKIIRKQTNLKLLTEFWPKGLDLAGVVPNDYLALLKKYGFEFWEISNKEKVRVKVTEDQLLKQYTLKNEGFANLLCIKK